MLSYALQPKQGLLRSRRRSPRKGVWLARGVVLVKRQALGTVLSAEVERQAKQRVRARYQVDPDFAGWRGLVLAELRKIEQGE